LGLEYEVTELGRTSRNRSLPCIAMGLGFWGHPSSAGHLRSGIHASIAKHLGTAGATVVVNYATSKSRKTCTAVEAQTLSECFSSFTIDSTTKAAPPLLVSQTTTGLYWDFHFQRSLPKGGDSTNAKANVTVDTKGDFFGERKSSLSTQTRYAFPVTASINFPVLRNFSLSPTYGAFLFQNQVSQQSILVNTFSIAAKWYYDRDSGVPFGRMFLFKGPGSQDQTKTAKMK
jgi:hypothetical protein